MEKGVIIFVLQTWRARSLFLERSEFANASKTFYFQLCLAEENDGV